MTNPRNKGQRSGKRRQRRDGYVDIWLPEHPLARRDGYVFEHRAVAFDSGLLTDPALDVHHRNHNRSDNRIENLEVLSTDEHARRHAIEDGAIANQFGVWPLRPPRPPKTERTCDCGLTIPVTLRADARYCSSRCRVNAWKRERRAS